MNFIFRASADIILFSADIILFSAAIVGSMTKSSKPKRIRKKETAKQKAPAKGIRLSRPDMGPEQTSIKYFKSENGKAAREKYENSEKGKARKQKYETSENGKATRTAWRQKLQTMFADNTINSKKEVQRMRPDQIRGCLCETWETPTYSTNSSCKTIEMKDNVVPPNASDEGNLD